MRCLPRVEGLGKRSWTRDRFDEALRKVGLSDTRPLKRAMNVKPNEALGKQKSLLILSTGVILSTGDVGCHTPLRRGCSRDPHILFEERSIKHASSEELATRVGRNMRHSM